MTPPSGPSPLKITSRRLIICLVLLNIVVILLLLPIYREIIIASPGHRLVEGSAETPHQQIQQRWQQQQQKQPRPLIRIPSKLPYISDEEFLKKYSAKYKGRLPSRDQDIDTTISDPSCGNNPDFFDFFTLPKTERSRFHEDKILYDLFFKNTTLPSWNRDYHPPLPKGTYIELGAFTGKEESNTIFFDKCLHWPGLLIEAQPQSYQKVMEHRPHAVTLSFSPTCPSSSNGNNNDTTTSFYNYPLSNNGMEGLAQSYIGKSTIQVPCGSLTPVLLDIFGPRGVISLFSLDVEGAELKVLQTIDFSKVNIDVMMVEVQNTYCPTGNCPIVHEIRKMMALTMKYALYTDLVEASDVYVRWGTEAWRRIKREMMVREGRDRMVKEAQMNLRLMGNTNVQQYPGEVG